MPAIDPANDHRSFWESHVVTCQRSSSSKAQYCREHQLIYHLFIYWYPQFNPNNLAPSSHDETPKFLPVAVQQSATALDLQIKLPNSAVITGITAHSADLVAALMAQL